MVKGNNLNHYEPIGITDDFMFFAVMSDEQICTRLLQELLPELKIKKVTTKAQSQIKGGREDKAIRLDIQAFDERGRIYDIEMQLSRDFQPKRSRYYKALVDMTTLLAGTDYDDLPPMFVIIFSPFDQFGDKERVSDYIVYCPKTHRALGDGTHVIYVNSKGVNGKVSPTMQKFLDLMNGQVDRNNALINDIAKKMDYYNHNQEWRANRLEYETTLRHEHKLGVDEGRKQGIDEGIYETTVKNALSVMVKFNVSAEQALDALGVPKSDQPKYLQMMKEKV